MSIFKRKKELCLYAVTNAVKNISQIEKTYTFAETEEDANEYIDRLLFLMNYEHYEMWCTYRKKEINDESWIEYAQSALQDAYSDYSIIKIPFSIETIASVFRIANSCIPIGCTFEKSVEYEVFLDSLSEDEKKEYEHLLKEYRESLKKESAKEK